MFPSLLSKLKKKAFQSQRPCYLLLLCSPKLQRLPGIWKDPVNVYYWIFHRNCNGHLFRPLASPLVLLSPPISFSNTTASPLAVSKSNIALYALPWPPSYGQFSLALWLTHSWVLIALVTSVTFFFLRVICLFIWERGRGRHGGKGENLQPTPCWGQRALRG